MEILHVLVPAAVIIVIIAIAIFFWAVRNGQFDDLERQGMNILLDDDSKPRRQPGDPKPANNKPANNKPANNKPADNKATDSSASGQVTTDNKSPEKNDNA